MAEWYTVEVKFKELPSAEQFEKFNQGMDDYDLPKVFKKPFLFEEFNWRSPYIQLNEDLLVIFKGLGLEAEVVSAFHGYEGDFSYEEMLFAKRENNYSYTNDFVITHPAWKDFQKNLERNCNAQ